MNESDRLIGLLTSNQINSVEDGSHCLLKWALNDSLLLHELRYHIVRLRDAKSCFKTPKVSAYPKDFPVYQQIIEAVVSQTKPFPDNAPMKVRSAQVLIYHIIQCKDSGCSLCVPTESRTTSPKTKKVTFQEPVQKERGRSTSSDGRPAQQRSRSRSEPPKMQSMQQPMSQQQFYPQTCQATGFPMMAVTAAPTVSQGQGMFTMMPMTMPQHPAMMMGMQPQAMMPQYMPYQVPVMIAPQTQFMQQQPHVMSGHLSVDSEKARGRQRAKSTPVQFNRSEMDTDCD